MLLTFIQESTVDLKIELFVVMQIRREYVYVVVKQKTHPSKCNGLTSLRMNRPMDI